MLIGYRASSIALLSTMPLSRAALRARSTPTAVPSFPAWRFLASQARRNIHIFRDLTQTRQHRAQLRLSGESIGLVPTMGALHAGHLSLVRAAAKENSKVWVTIYVNPTQFGVHEDLDSYPKTWDSDLAKLKDLDASLEAEGLGRIDAIFAPTTKVMYPTLPPDSAIPGVGSFVTITPLANYLEGKSRPVFFRGVATVCMKLFNIVEAERVYFGQKDAQQTVVIKRMVKDFHLNTEVRIIPTEREADGLAMSSRNVYLGERRRNVGVVLSQALRAAATVYEQGKEIVERDDILGPAREVIDRMSKRQHALPANEQSLFELDYISLAHPDTLLELQAVNKREGAILSGAIKMLPLASTSEGEELGLGNDIVPVRLIDNIPLMAVY